MEPNTLAIQHRGGTTAFEKKKKRKEIEIENSAPRGRASRFSELRQEARKGNWRTGAGKRDPHFGGMSMRLRDGIWMSLYTRARVDRSTTQKTIEQTTNQRGKPELTVQARLHFKKNKK